MDADFWHSKWHAGDTGFHEDQVNALLAAHFGRLGLAGGARVFLPLCGKTRDIAWLLERGIRVVGAELSPLAVGELFEGLGVVPEVAPVGSLQHHRAAGIDVFLGDIFDLDRERLGAVDAVYDRAALVALPPVMRARYAEHLLGISEAAPQLLVTFEYDQSQLEGPPFSVEEAEVRALYEARFALTSLARSEVEGGLKGKVEAHDRAWLLERRA
ncbi:MAG: thiopurine S-methyltransferase [Rhodocyclaceae bacterium]|nr:thiopurine S-methyltransferase [Rhodocyclaceae bacterium]